MVTAIDDYSAQPGPFAALDEEDADEEKNEEHGDGSSSGSKSAPLDFTQDSTTPSTPQTPPSKQRKHSVSSRKLQLRPDPYTPSDKDSLDHQKSLTRIAEEAWASLADHAVFWNKQRTDLKLVMRSGLNYLDAFQLVNGDHLVHPRIPVRELTLMLARMMYWGRLNHTPWAKYVPSWGYKKAESYLDNLDGAPARWPTLKKLRLDDSAEVMEALFSGVGESEDDVDRDVTFKSSVEFKPQAPRTTPPREAKRRRGLVSSVSSSSALTVADPPSEPPAKRHRPALDRRRSVLARKEYSELAPDELALVETPGRGVMSWRQYGILLKFAPGTANAIEQTTGFPDYTPNLSKTSELEAVRARWDPPSFKVLWVSAPWDDLFQQRLKFLILHSADDLSARAKSDLVDIVEFMWQHRRTFWLIGQWFFIDHHRDDYSAGLHTDRKKECDAVKKNYKKLLDDKVRGGLPESVLEEPGIWTFPTKCCFWVWMDSAPLNEQSRPLTLTGQLKIVDKLEPARVQWNSCDSDDQRVAYLSSSLRKKLLPESERRRYPVSTQRP
ncbi:hypothetical protein PF005_g26534 [Phytophthora fragariae]|uniref:Uncharacterized protein n=1 Tax=Phytophthora fragariae TaxID=53985 RepID=A0A6A4BUD4_9STRA|nr:hypothetical protein PF003_g37495 [Phytophthora fragariae]KAE8923257.1 hypothetical protein PF009_g26493 [Phytophthora fragariae]KAE9073342.1 hypothetical protein PF007_g25840 [Phytophthora fragariae]KAE9090366.1 hypothetical protein PF006_g25176 [Phytophthora fragariae]KAE9172828.1 hypothetical protein PF005_g26534 [Phytophthora fragariae]